MIQRAIAIGLIWGGVAIAAEAAALSGSVSYSGRQTGTIWVVASTTTNSWSTNYHASIATTGAYSIAGIPTPSNWWVRAWRDSNGNRSNDALEAWGDYAGNPIWLTNSFTNAIVALADPDTDCDGMPDWWEVLQGLNTMFNDAGADPDLDGVSNRDEYQYGLTPTLADSDGDGTNDYAQAYGKEWTKHYYDALDRLLGTEYSRGLSVGYEYDGNGNILRQIYMRRDQDGDGLPDLWEFLNGLSWTNAAQHGGALGDADGDGWSNWQEWQAGSAPGDGASLPPRGDMELGFDFTPSRYVMAVGDLDGDSVEEVVIAADGFTEGMLGGANPPENTICLLRQTTGGWLAERVSVGQASITSAAIGEPQIGHGAAIYVGTRRISGSGLVLELKPDGGGWATNAVAASSGHAASVAGVRPGRDVLAVLDTNGLQNVVCSLAVGAGQWSCTLLDTNGCVEPQLTLVDLGLPDETLASLRMLPDGTVKIGEGPTDDLFAHYPFDGSLADESGNGRDLIDGGRRDPDEIHSTNRFGDLDRALALDGACDFYVTGQGGTCITDPSGRDLSFGGWICPSNLTGVVLSSGAEDGSSAGVFLWVRSGQTNMCSLHLRVSASDAMAESDRVVQVPAGQWTHVFAVFTASNHMLRVFKDGELADVATGQPEVNPSSYTRYAVGAGIEGDSGYTGLMDDLRVYERALTDTEVRLLHEYGAASTRLASPAGARRLPLPFGGLASGRMCAIRTDGGWREFAGHEYKLFGAGLPWSGATGTCESVDGYIACPESRVEWEWLKSVLDAEGYGAGIWLGGSDSAVEGEWRWMSGTPMAFADWGAGEPGSQDYLATAADADRRWQDSAPSTSRGYVCEVRARPSVAILSVADLNASGVADEGDAVLMEQWARMRDRWEAVGSWTNGTIGADGMVQGTCGAVDRNGEGDCRLYAGDQDGRVVVWASSYASNALPKEAFSGAWQGVSWHALAGHRGWDGAAEALAGLVVEPSRPQYCRFVYGPPGDTDFRMGSVPQTAPLTQILPSPDSGGGLSLVKLRIWDAEANASLPVLQFSTNGSPWTDAHVVRLNERSYSLAMAGVAAMPTGTTHELLWNSGADLGAGFSNSVLLRARSMDVTLWGPWSQPMVYRVTVTDDSNRDGIPDAWCLHYGLDPLATNGPHHATGSADGTGVDNLFKYEADLDPTNPASRLELTDISILPHGLQVGWIGGCWATQYLETRRSMDSTSEQWTVIFTNLPPTAPAPQIVDAGATNGVLFYRVKAAR